MKNHLFFLLLAFMGLILHAQDNKTESVEIDYFEPPSGVEWPNFNPDWMMPVTVNFTESIVGSTLTGITVNGNPPTSTSIWLHSLDIRYPFDWDNTYEIIIPTAAINDYSGPDIYYYVVTPPNIPLTITAYTPAQNATGVALDAPVYLTFSKNIITNPLFPPAITIIKTGGGAVGGVSYPPVQGNANTLIIEHDNFDYDAEYTVNVPENTVPAYEGGAISWKFTTASGSGVPLALNTLLPNDHATGVGINTSVKAIFNKNITIASTAGITINGETATISANMNILTVNHATFNPNTPYTVFIPLGTVAEYNEDITWSFTTAINGTLYNNLYCDFLMGMSPNGQYVTGYNISSGSVLWTEENGLTNLTPIDGSMAYVISDNGIAAGQFYDPELKYYDEWDNMWYNFPTGGFYQNGEWHLLPLNPAYPIHIFAGNLAEGISADGTIIGGSRAVDRDPRLEPCIWNNGVPTVLEHTPTGQGARLQGLSADGTVAAGWANPTNYGRQPVVWINGELRQIKHNNTWGFGECFKVSPNGRYVALSYGPDPAVYDVLLDKLTLIEFPEGEWISGDAVAVSDDGIVVGRLQYGLMFDRDAFIYSEQLGISLLSDYLTSIDIPEAKGIQFGDAEAISADGLCIAGFNRLMGTSWVVKLYEHLTAVNPPKNLVIEETDFRNVALTWEAPTNDPDYTFSGYNLYRNGIQLNTTLLTHTTYNDIAIPNGHYVYYVTAVWNGDLESVSSNKVTINLGEVSLPFFENFSSANFNTNYWNISSALEWTVTEYNGINPPCAQYIAPSVNDYSDYLLSPYIDATNADDLFLSFNYAPANSNFDITKHHLKIELFDGAIWHTVHDFSAVPEWVSSFSFQQFDISNIGAHKQIRLRFTASGEDSQDWFIMWLLDNICVFTSQNALVLSDPVRVRAHVSDDGTVHVNWADPGEVATLSYLEVPEYAIGYIGNEGKPFIAGAKFEANDLIGYHDYQMISISAFLFNISYSVPTLKLAVFRGTERIVDQIIPSYEKDQWNTFTLHTPISLSTGTEPLYFGIEVVTHDYYEMPIGTSLSFTPNENEPYEGRANLYSENGGKTWGTLTEFAIPGSIAVMANLVHHDGAVAKERLLGYKVFRDGTNLVGTDGDGNDYLTRLHNLTDLNPTANPEQCYQVVAYYDTQQGSEEVEYCLNNIRINETKEPVKFHIYPNPVHDRLTISSLLTNKALVEIYNNRGALVQRLEINQQKTEINVFAFPAGVYFIRMIEFENKGNSTTLRFVKE